jgi:hypothetical protein
MIMKFKKFTMNELKDALINLDPKIVTSDACSTLLPFCPDAEEMQICKSFDGNLEELDMVKTILNCLKSKVKSVYDCHDQCAKNANQIEDIFVQGGVQGES